MYLKYLKLILTLGIILHASPKSFDSLGDELEVFKSDCKSFQSIEDLPLELKGKCKLFISDINDAFDLGYQLDLPIDNKQTYKEKLDNYLIMLRELDKNKNDILHLAKVEKIKARKTNKIEYYAQLILNKNIKLYSSDYKYIELNKETFKNNKRYQQYIGNSNSYSKSRKIFPKKENKKANVK